MKLILISLALIATMISMMASFAQDPVKGALLYKQCIECHGERGDGSVAKKAPRIAGQYDWYVLKQLEAIKAGSARKNPVMVPIVSKLNETDMKDLAAYISKI